MKSKDTKQITSIFELFEILYDYEYNEEKDEDIPPQYPEFNVKKYRTGVFSSLTKAEQGMKDYVEEEKKRGRGEEKDLFGFLIEEYSLDKLTHFWEKSMRNYLPDGSLLDECLVSSEPDEERELIEFLGRPAEKVRYKNGDLVEELYLKDTVRLAIIGNPPWSPEKVNECINRSKLEHKGRYIFLDSSDDVYYTLGVCEDDDDDTHEHPSPICLFPLRFPVNYELRSNLEKQYKRYRAYFDK